MSSASHTRVSSRSERRTTNDNGSSRAPSGQQGGSRAERQDPRRPPSPQASVAGTTHKRTASSSQRTKGGVEERRTERVQVTTRETVTSRTRSPERRPGPSVQPQERVKLGEAGRAYPGDPRPKSSKVEAHLGMTPRSQRNSYKFLTSPSTMDSRSVPSTSYKCTFSISSIDPASRITGSTVIAAKSPPRTDFGGSRSGRFGGPAIRVYGI